MQQLQERGRYLLSGGCLSLFVAADNVAPFGGTLSHGRSSRCRWHRYELLPAIRNTGGYGTGQAAPALQIPTTLSGTPLLAVQQTFGGNDAPPSATMTSLELVAFINNERSQGGATLVHSDFLKKVPQVLGGGHGNFSDTYRHPQNGQTYPCYRFPKREACLMAMSYSYELQAKVFDKMTALEHHVLDRGRPSAEFAFTGDKGRRAAI